MNTHLAAASLLLASLISTPLIAKDIVLFGVAPESYAEEALKLALSKIESKNYQVSTYRQPNLPKQRAFERLESTDNIDVIFGGSNIERDSQHLPVRIPLLRGLNGWRALLTRKNSKYHFNMAQKIDDLKALDAGSFHNWSDTRVLEANGLPVVKGNTYPALYKMLEKGRFDYFPRSVLEIETDYLEYQHLDIEINRSVLIYYPTAYYFFVSKSNIELAEEIEQGLKLAMADGSLDKLFYEFYGSTIERYKKLKPRVIKLANPFLSKLTPLDEKSFWIDLSSEPGS